jgi:amidase
MLPVAQASDGAGSIRIPASFCGLIGHKPSRALLANPYRHVDNLGMTTCGAITRTVADAAAMLDVLTLQTPGARGSYLAALDKPLPALRVRFTTTAPIDKTVPAVDAAVRRVAAALVALGHEVVELPPLAATLEEFQPIYQRLAANALVLRPRLLQPVTTWLRTQGRLHRLADMLARRDTLAARMLSWCGDADIVLTPTVPRLPPRVGEFSGLPPAECFARAAVLGAFTAMCNLTGQPAISIPVALDSGLPIGAQLIGRVGGDAQLLMLAQQLVAALPPFPAAPPRPTA